MLNRSAQRRLAAILAVDVAGYTRLMERDTDATVAAWKRARSDVIEPAIGALPARVIKFTGDGFLAEFSSVQDAVGCAMDLQRNLASSSLDFRMGIHLGDVTDDGVDVHGEGVNIAARIESLAEPGGICISQGVYDQVRNRIEARFENMGERHLKHVSTPVRIYAIHSQASTMPSPSAPLHSGEAPPPLPDKPSIAVLPFDNLSGEADQESFADGMAEDLITDLSKVSGLFVVARNSSFVFKGQSTDVRSVGARLGVRHVLEGSIRRSGNRVRINAQLIDVSSGGHTWADRFDGTVDDVFALQDQVSAAVVDSLSVHLTRDEVVDLKRVHTSNLEAYELYVRARATPYPPVPERISAAREMFEKVVEIDRDFAGGYAGISFMLSFGAMWSHVDESESIAGATEMAERAVAVDDHFGWGHSAVAVVRLLRRQYRESLRSARRAVECQPNDADARAFLGLIQGLAGDPGTGTASIEHALRLNPQFVYGPYLNMLGQTHLLASEFDAAIDAYERNVRRQGPIGPPALCWGAAAYHAADRGGEAVALARRLRTDYPRFTTVGWNYLGLIRDDAVRARVEEQMHDAGIPGAGAPNPS